MLQSQKGIDGTHNVNTNDKMLNKYVYCDEINIGILFTAMYGKCDNFIPSVLYRTDGYNINVLIAIHPILEL